MLGMKEITNPKIPWVETLAQELEAGQEFIFEGVSQNGSTGFSINLALGPMLEGANRSDIALHFNVRYKERRVARNSFIRGKWDKEDNLGCFPFAEGVNFIIRILTKNDRFDVEVDGRLFISFRHRLPINLIKCVQVVEDVAVKRLCIPCPQISSMLRVKAINYPNIPWVETFDQELSPGQDITIEGISQQGSKGFAFNLALGPILEGLYRSDIGFHFNVRYNERYVPRNSFIRGKWEKEEGTGCFPFMEGVNFIIKIVPKHDRFDVEVDGRYFISFLYRVPIKMVKCLQIVGDVVVTTVKIPSLQQIPPLYPTCPPISGVQVIYPTAGSPTYNPIVPFDHMLPSPLNVGKSIFLTGQVLQFGKNFRIELLSPPTNRSKTQDENVNLRFNITLAPPTNSVTRNSRTEDVWGNDEISIPSFPFVHGSSFDITIRCEGNRFAILVNNVYFCSFSHRLPYHAINKVRVEGDVQIHCVSFD